MTTSSHTMPTPGAHSRTGGHTLCVGCGVCATFCPKQRIQMTFSSQEGFYRPSCTASDCDAPCGLCVRVCPFAPSNASTTEIAQSLFATSEGVQNDNVLGYYLGTYSGFSEKHRATSASGGLVTGVLQSLLRQGIIDGAMCVGSDPASPTLFDFRICKTETEIAACSGSCYQPVEINRALLNVLCTPGRYAIVALPCMAKALRIAANNNPTLASRIKFIIGLTCGQVKSRHFIDYLCRKENCPSNPTAICFRYKTQTRPASNFMYRFQWPDGTNLSIGWSETIARRWRERWFTLEACDYCDDVFAECADAAFMDAWLPQYSSDPRGHSLAVIRNPELQRYLVAARSASSLAIEEIAPSEVIKSQEGVIHQKRILVGLNAQCATRGGVRLPLLRIPQTSHRVLHRLEAWTKRAIRHTTSRGAEYDLSRMELRIAILSIPWRVLNLALGIARRLFQTPTTRTRYVQTGFSAVRRIFGRKTRLPNFGTVGIGCQILGGYFGTPEKIRIGNYVYIGPDVCIAGRGGVVVGDGSIIATRVIIRSSNHRYDGSDLARLPFDDVALLQSVTIGENVWIGDHAIICPGVNIGEGAVIGMGAVVSKDIPSLGVAVGNPARVVKMRDKARYDLLKSAGRIYWKERSLGRLASEREIIVQ